MQLIDSLKNKMQASLLLQRIIKAVVFGVGGSVGSRALIMLSGIIISRIIGKIYYGQFSMVNSTVTLFVTFSGLGIGATLTRYVALYRNEPKKLGGIIPTLSTFVLLLSVIMSLAMFLLANKVSFWVAQSNSLTGYFKIAAVTVFFSALGSNQQSVMLGMEKYKKIAAIELTRCGVYIILATLLSIWQGVNGAVLALLISYILQLLLSCQENIKEYKASRIMLKFNFDQTIKNIIWRFTIPAFMASIFVIPVNWINNAMLAKYAGFGDLAIFSVALQWMTMVTYIPSQMGQVKPIYTDLFAKAEYDELKKMFNKITLISCALVLPVIVLGIIFSKYILALYGAGYKAGYLTFILLMAAAFLITIQSQIGAFLQAIGKMWLGFVLNLIWSVTILVTFYCFRAWGSMGYAMAYCIAYGLHTLLSYGFLSYIWKRVEEYSGTCQAS